MISTLVAQVHSDGRIPPSPIAKVAGRLSISTISDLTGSATAYGGDKLEAADIVYVFLTSDNASAATDALPELDSEPPVLRLKVPDGKKGQIHFLQDVLPRSMVYLQKHLADGKQVCIACNNGRDMSVGVALAALQKFFDGEGNFVSPGTALATRQYSFADCLVCSKALIHPFIADKKSIRTRLEWIISSRPLANPSRTTLKRVNEFLLTSGSFRALAPLSTT